MNIDKSRCGSALSIALSGRLDTLTAPELDEVISNELEGVEELTFDLSGLEYISSSGLRSLLSAQKLMNAQGSMKVLNPNEIVAEVFEITGFSEIFTIE